MLNNKSFLKGMQVLSSNGLRFLDVSVLYQPKYEELGLSQDKGKLRKYCINPQIRAATAQVKVYF